jgi:hypothetical protein
MEDDGVLSAGLDLNDGVTGRAASRVQMSSRDTFGGEFFAQPNAVGPDGPEVADVESGAGQRDGLVKAFAARSAVIPGGGERFAGAQKMRHAINVIEVDRTEVANAWGSGG